MTDLNVLHESIDRYKSWTPSEFNVNLYDSPGNSSSSRIVDLVQFIPPVSEQDQSLKWCPKNDERFYFDEKHRSPKEIAYMLNKNSCIENGYEVVVASTKKNDSALIKCKCFRAVDHGRGDVLVTHSFSAARKKDLCNFCIVLKVNKGGQYFIRKNGGSNLKHNGHLSIASNKKYMSSDFIDEDVKHDAAVLLAGNAGSIVVQDFIARKTGFKLSDSTLSSLKASVVDDSAQDGCIESNAEKLLRKLQEDEDVTYRAYIGSYVEAQNAVTVRRRRSTKRKEGNSKFHEEGMPCILVWIIFFFHAYTANNPKTILSSNCHQA